MTIRHDNMIIETQLPLSQILSLEMHHTLNNHGTLRLNGVVEPERQRTCLQTHYQGQNIQFFQHQEAEPILIFSGKIQTVTYEKQNQWVTASIEAISYSIELDEDKKNRSFQNTNRTFNQLLDLITKESHARFNWEMGQDKPLNKPFIQYNETDWQFIRRLASYFNRPLQTSLHSLQPDFYFGIRSGKSQVLVDVTLLERGVSDDYYQNGGYEAGTSRHHYRYIKVKHRAFWELGDFVWDQGQKLTVMDQLAVFEKGELNFIQTLGAEGFLYQKTLYSQQLIGLNLPGTIRRTEKESLAVQLDIDKEEQAHYLWPWVPEIGNLSYLMPEVGSKAVLTFPSHDEKEAMATHLLRTNSNSQIYDHKANKQMVTQHQKTIGLYPDQLLLAGKGRNVMMALEDQTGVQLESNTSIRLKAQDQIQLTGQKVTLKAPEQILMQTAHSNIEMAQNFNFYAPVGVKTNSSRPYQPPVTVQPSQRSDPNHWPLSFGAQGAVPSVNLDQMDSDSIIDLATKGAVPNMAKGQTTIAMSELMNGEKAQDTTHAQVFASLGSHTLKGGSFIPTERED